MYVPVYWVLIPYFALLALTTRLTHSTWSKVNEELQADSPSAGRAFLRLFGAGICLMILLLIGTTFVGPVLADLWKEYPAGSKTLSLGELINQYATGLSFVFSIPTALAGSVVAILLALRALRSADDVKTLTAQQTKLMQEQNALQTTQINLGNAQFFNENRQKILSEVEDIHRLYFELCDSLASFCAIVRRDAFSFFRNGFEDMDTPPIQERHVIESRQRFLDALKGIAASPSASRLWRHTSSKLSKSLIGALKLEMANHSHDSPVNIDLADITSIVFHCQVNDMDSDGVGMGINKFVNKFVRNYVVTESLWRASLSAKSRGLSDNSSPAIDSSPGVVAKEELDQISEICRASWDGATQYGPSYLADRCLVDAMYLPASECKGLAQLLAKELRYVPLGCDDLMEFLKTLSYSVNNITQKRTISAADWFPFIQTKAELELFSLGAESKTRCSFVGSGAVLAQVNGYAFHNLGLALLADVIQMMPDSAMLADYLRADLGKELNEVFDRLVANGHVQLDIRSFLPTDLLSAAQWVHQHPVLPLIAPITFAKTDGFDELFGVENWEAVPMKRDRHALLKAMGLNVGDYQT